MTTHTVPDSAGLLSEPDVRQDAMSGLSRLESLSLEELAKTPEAARIVARATRKGLVEVEPVTVARFNSYI